MIPLRDSEAARRLTPATTLLIVLNTAVFVLEVEQAYQGRLALERYAMVPALVAHPGWLHPLHALRVLVTLVTATFLHAGLLHIAGNMLYLLIFGPAVEGRMGPRRFLLFYLLCGIAAGLGMVAMGPASRVPVIGASGAIAGVLGAYFVLYPRGRISTILPLFVFIRLVEVPAVFYLLAWFAVQLYAGISAGGQGPLVGGVAWWAHVGGFLFGVAAAPLLIHNARAKRPARRKQC
ncbi:MAG TPA: rhomboid family intramembrane serine protease [Candidatus Binataceae bacterium]|nr:rhomboid family intramembrane serine protease [Candidatus Binataceae bacterium]